MRRRDLEKLPSVSVRGRVYVELDAVVEALEAEAKAETAEKPTEAQLDESAALVKKLGKG